MTQLKTKFIFKYIKPPQESSPPKKKIAYLFNLYENISYHGKFIPLCELELFLKKYNNDLTKQQLEYIKEQQLRSKNHYGQKIIDYEKDFSIQDCSHIKKNNYCSFRKGKCIGVPCNFYYLKQLIVFNNLFLEHDYDFMSGEQLCNTEINKFLKQAMYELPDKYKDERVELLLKDLKEGKWKDKSIRYISFYDEKDWRNLNHKYKLELWDKYYLEMNLFEIIVKTYDSLRKQDPSLPVINYLDIKAFSHVNQESWEKELKSYYKKSLPRVAVSKEVQKTMFDY